VTMSRAGAYQSIVEGTSRAIDAAEVALIRGGEGVHSVLAVSSNGRARRSAGESLSAETADSLGFVLASGQPLSIGPQATGDAPAGDMTSGPVLVVPCVGDSGVTGALEIRGSTGTQPFGPEASRLASLFADVAAALFEDDGGSSNAPSPVELGAELTRLAETEPARYVAMAATIEALLGRG
jgi:hypothetical protein